MASPGQRAVCFKCDPVRTAAFEQLFYVADSVVGDAYRTRQLVVIYFLEREPHRFGHQGNRPVDEIEIDIRKAEAFKAFVECLFRIKEICRQQFCRDENFLSRNPALARIFLYGFTHTRFISVECSRVDMSITGFKCPFYCLLRLFSLGHLPRTQSEYRHLDTVIQTDRFVRWCLHHGSALYPALNA